MVVGNFEFEIQISRSCGAYESWAPSCQFSCTHYFPGMAPLEEAFLPGIHSPASLACSGMICPTDDSSLESRASTPSDTFMVPLLIMVIGGEEGGGSPNALVQEYLWDFDTWKLFGYKLYRAEGISWVKGSVCFVLKFAFPPFSPPLTSGVQISRHNIHQTFCP